MTYIPPTDAELKQADLDYKAASPATRRAWRRWCQEQPNGAAPFNDQAWVAWRKATAATEATEDWDRAIAWIYDDQLPR